MLVPFDLWTNLCHPNVTPCPRRLSIIAVMSLAGTGLNHELTYMYIYLHPGLK